MCNGCEIHDCEACWELQKDEDYELSQIQED